MRMYVRRNLEADTGDKSTMILFVDHRTELNPMVDLFWYFDDTYATGYMTGTRQHMQIQAPAEENKESGEHMVDDGHKAVVEELAQSLNDSSVTVTYSHEITDILYSKNLPIHLLGLLRFRTKNLRLKGLILVEMLAISFRDMIFDYMREKPQDFVDFILKRLNLYLCLDSESEAFYNGDLSAQINTIFHLSEYQEELASSDLSSPLYKKVNAAMLFQVSLAVLIESDIFQLMRSITVHALIEFTTQARSKMTTAFSSADSLKRSNLRSSFLNESASREPLMQDKSQPTTLLLHDIELSTIHALIKRFDLDVNETQLDKMHHYSKRKQSGSQGTIEAPKMEQKKREERDSPPPIERRSSHTEKIDEEEWVVIDDHQPPPRETMTEDLKLFKKKMAVGMSKLRTSFISLLENDKK
ncbi:hypothetical protein PROFUN_04166 [Planoprotostelium fungivorum]|uniref:Uncharacterized protein n=1 Tax=Planoprotostelium fungivorum TaxID=1890364 RepID=A0A2P6NVT3_9EUKA|nr:hypothetical protein PROFUN_04166 [Planoprotostelium fungivorum]